MEGGGNECQMTEISSSEAGMKEENVAAEGGAEFPAECQETRAENVEVLQPVAEVYVKQEVGEEGEWTSDMESENISVKEEALGEAEEEDEDENILEPFEHILVNSIKRECINMKEESNDAASAGTNNATVRANLQRGLFVLTKPRGSSLSTVWKEGRFSLIVDKKTWTSVGYVQCESCKSVYKFSSGCTSTMKRHKCKVMAERRSAVPPSMTRKLTQSAASMCARDLQTFSIIRGKGFLDFAQELINLGAMYGKVDATEEIPKADVVAQKVSAIADNIRMKIVPHVQEAIENHMCAMSTDMWSDKYRRVVYCTVSAHFINLEWELCKSILYTAKFDEDRKTAVTLQDDLRAHVALLQISPSDLQNVIFVSDSDPTIRAALSPYKRQTCSAHNLNTVLTHTFHEINCEAGIITASKTINACKETIKYLKKSGLVSQLQKTIYQHVDTRRNSMLLMLQSVHEQLINIRTVLRVAKQEEKLAAYDARVASDLIEFLKLFREASEELENDNSPTLHLVLLWFHKLLRHCTATRIDSKVITHVKSRAKAYLQEKMEIQLTHKIATMLCPPFRHLKMLSAPEIEAVHVEVQKMCKEIGEDTGADSQAENLEAPADKKSRLELNFEGWMDDEDYDSARDELHRYIHSAGSMWKRGDNVLSWWRVHESDFPSLSKLARRFLAVPAASASSECNRSKAGVVVLERRTRLAPDVLDDILIVHNEK